MFQISSVVVIFLSCSLILIGFSGGTPSNVLIGVIAALVGGFMFLSTEVDWVPETKFKLSGASLITRGAFQLIGTTLVFIIIFIFFEEPKMVLRIFELSTILGSPLTYISTGLGFSIGCGFFILINRSIMIRRLTESIIGRIISSQIVVVIYIIIFLSEPIFSILYAGSYIISRLSTLLMYSIILAVND